MAPGSLPLLLLAAAALPFAAARRELVQAAVQAQHRDSHLHPQSEGPPPLLEFQIYRAGDSAWPAKNSDRERSRNFANAAGVLRYIHNEVVGRNVAAEARPPHCNRKNSIDTIYRYKVTMRSTAPTQRVFGSFLPYVAMDDGQCTVPGCDALWWKPYGYVPGCQSQDERAFHYPDAVWYSFPGRCPGRKTATGNCEGDVEAADPGGACRPMLDEDGEAVVPDGSWNCTYTYEPQGSVSIDELVGIRKKYGSYKKFCMAGGVEFNGPEDDEEGLTMDFWRGYKDLERNSERVGALLALFEKKYPGTALQDDPGCNKPWERPWYWPGSTATRPPPTTTSTTTTSMTESTTATTTSRAGARAGLPAALLLALAAAWGLA